MAIPVYAIFEGGGAKGLAHIGALQAAEENDLSFLGVAGASAGAVIASLVAVGYKSSEMLNRSNPNDNLLTRRNLTPIGLIGEARWRKFTNAQDRVSQAAKVLLCVGPLTALIERTVFGVGREIYSSGGYFSTEAIKETLNEIYREKLQEHYDSDPALQGSPAPDRVTFGHISPANVSKCRSLKIIVTDVTDQRMVVFDSMNRAHWGIEVAEAVTASLSIPFVFKPAKIKSFPPYDNHLYADGGMVSNMPVWVFADEKLHYERRYLPRSKVMIVAFSLKADEDETVADGFQFLRYASAVARVAVFGGQQVVRRFISDLLAIELPVALRTTQFDFSMSHALEAYDAANRRASEILSQQTVTRPREARETMEWFRDAVLGRIGLQRPSASPTHLRIMLIKRSGDESFEVVESLNAENDADDRLLFSSFAEGAPSAFIQRRPVLLDIGGRWTDFDSLWATYGAFGPIGAFSPSVTKYEHALVRRSLKSAICVPIFGGSDASTAWEITNPLDRPEPVGIVSIDSDSDLTHVFRDNALMEVIAARSVVFGGILSSLGAQGHG